MSEQQHLRQLRDSSMHNARTLRRCGWQLTATECVRQARAFNRWAIAAAKRERGAA